MGRWAAIFAAVLGAASGLLAPFAQAQPAAQPLAAELRHARDLAGADPPRARAELRRLRAEALQRGAVAARLEADEIECRLVGDIDTAAALVIARDGLASVAEMPLQGPALLSLRRLIVCEASLLSETDRHLEAIDRLENLIGSTTGVPGMASAHALALIERGVYRSRRGNFTDGQADLLSACERLRTLDIPQDLELCLHHVASHYKRVGDLDEARKYLTQLVDGARARGADFDEGIYAHALGQVYVRRAEWSTALHYFEEALSLKAFAEDPTNIAYVETGIGDALVRSGRTLEALPHLARALAVLTTTEDMTQTLRATVIQATALARSEQARRAVQSLADIEARVRAQDDALLLSEWLAAQAEARAAIGDWRTAYVALDAYRGIEARIQAQQSSDQQARMRMQFNREKDAVDLAALRQLNDRGQQLRQTQALALLLFVLLLAVTVAYAAHKFRQARRLQTLALSDDLTGLPNRRAVLARAEALHAGAGRAASAFSLLVIDVDHFKRVNDEHGHAVGDEVLRHLAGLLPTSLRASDMLGRLGGEEFLAVLPNATAQQAATVAERMRQSIEHTPTPTSAGPLALSVSIGVASLGAEAGNVAELIRRADAALYEAKARGRNRVQSAAAPVEPALAAAA